MVVYAQIDGLKDIIVTTPAGFGVMMLLSGFAIYALFGDLIQDKLTILVHKLERIIQ